MTESLDLPSLPRETLLPPAERLARLDRSLPQITAILAGETDAVALQATMARLLWETCIQTNWCGFYRRVDERTLAVGPYQGTLGCLRIDIERGVCGAALRTGVTQLVPDVHAFPGHIACDSRSRSELVVPVFASGRVRAVLDLDSPHADGFSKEEAERLERLLAATFESTAIVW
jgi:L-methionine (R)-S-oxide reductase